MLDQVNEEQSGDQNGVQAPVGTNEAQTTPETFELYSDGKPFTYGTNAEFILKDNGQAQRIPASKIFNGYRQIANLERNQKAFNGEREAFLAEQKKFREEMDRLGGMDSIVNLQKWSLEKPDEFQAMMEWYNNRDKNLLAQKMGTDPQGLNLNPLLEKLSGLEGKLSKYDSIFSQMEQEEMAAKEQADAELIKGQIDAFKKEFPEINLDELDADGVPVRAKVVQFGIEKGLPDFDTAAAVFFKPKLLEVAALRARTEAVKGVQKDTKAGIIAKGAEPFKRGEGQTTSKRPRSWEDASEAAKAMYAQLATDAMV